MNNKIERFPLLPVRNTVLFPGVAMPILVRREGGVRAIEKARSSDGLLIVVAQKDGKVLNPQPKDFYRIGTLAKIEYTKGNPRQGFQLVIRGLAHFEITDVQPVGSGRLKEISDESLRSQAYEALGFERLRRKPENPERVQVLLRRLKDIGKEALSLFPGDTEKIERLVDESNDPLFLTYLAAANLNLDTEEAQALLEETSLEEKLGKVILILERQKEQLRVQREVGEKMSERLAKSQREALLREQLRTIREELGESETGDPDKLRKRIEEAGMPEQVRKIALEELRRLESQGPQSPETNMIRTYLDWLCNMPWAKSTDDQLDLNIAQEILDEDHAGLERIKRRVLQHLAVMKLRSDLKGSILCFVGPPGVGKTSLGQSIARALGRKFSRVSLGGVRDEAEIRGHRRTYIGAMPGKIIQALKRVESKNPVMMLDEIDKLSMSYHGDPSSALLEVLDPEQNHSFGDHYLDVPFDLSKVFFIATANTLETIPAPLLDRMEVIQLTGYTAGEKLEIARRYLVPKQLREHGLDPKSIRIEGETLRKIISEYTREAGVRNLQRQIAALCRAIAERRVKESKEKQTEQVLNVTSEWLEDALGTPRFESEVSADTMPPGVVTGLAWTPMGGEILFVEAQSMPGKGGMTLTGQLGDVMKESAQIALTLVRSRLPEVAPKYEFEKRDLHIHVPSGAIPKDGPSAGIAIFSAIGSLFSGRRVDPKTAMSGEITLRGAVMPVGGVKEKVIAAHRAGIKRVILSSKNRKDLKEIPAEVKEEVKFEFVDTVDEVLRLTLGIEAVPGFSSPDYRESFPVQERAQNDQAICRS